jgi:hypothetical protein
MFKDVKYPNSITILYCLFGGLMFIWYGAIRWTMFQDETLYWWAYKPMNLATAFLSIYFICATLFIPFSTKCKYLFLSAIFLAFRNFYYALEDIIDLHINVPQQLFFIGVDLMMMVYSLLYLIIFYFPINGDNINN